MKIRWSPVLEALGAALFVVGLALFFGAISHTGVKYP